MTADEYLAKLLKRLPVLARPGTVQVDSTKIVQLVREAFESGVTYGKPKDFFEEMLEEIQGKIRRGIKGK